MRADLIIYEGGYIKVLGLIEQGSTHAQIQPDDCQYKDSIHRLEDRHRTLPTVSRSIGADVEEIAKTTVTNPRRFLCDCYLCQHTHHSGHLEGHYQTHPRLVDVCGKTSVPAI